MGTPSDLLTTTEAAARVGVAPAYVRLLCLMGRVPYIRIGPLLCVTPADLDAWNRERLQKREHRLARKATKRGEVE